MHPPEVSYYLTAQELLAAPTVPAAMVEVDDISDVDPLPRTDSSAANTDQTGAPAESVAAQADSVEIELTAEQMLAMLEQP